MTSLLALYDSKRNYEQMLEGSRAGQILQHHIETVEHLHTMHGRMPCPHQRCSDMSRILLTKLKENRTWLGLPPKLPRAIAFLHLSGETLLLYGEALALVYIIVCAGVDTKDHRVGLGVQHMMSFAEMHDTSLLLTLALPWQSGPHTQYWEIRSLRRTGEGELIDGEQIFTCRGDEGQRAGSIAQSAPPSSKLLKVFSRKIEEQVRAVCIDTSAGGEGKREGGDEGVGADAGAGGSGGEGASLQSSILIKTLRNSCSDMDKQRKEVIEENRELVRKHALALRTQKEQIEKELVEERTRHESTRAERDRAQEELSTKRGTWESESRKLNGEVLELGERLKKTEEQVAGLRDLRDAAQKAERTAVQTLAHEREQQKLMTEDFHEGSERRVSELTLRINSLNAELSAEKHAAERKEAVLEGVRAERDALQYDGGQQLRGLRTLRVTLAVARVRVLEERRIARKKLEEEAKRVKALERKAAASGKRADEATRTAAAAEKRAAEATTEATAATAVTQATEPVAATKSSADASVNTEPQGDPPEVLQVQKLLDEKHAEIQVLQKKLLEAEARAGTGGVVFGGHPAIDAILEGLAIESRRVQQQLYSSARHAQHQSQQQQGGANAYDPAAHTGYYNPMLTGPAYGGGYY